jgi:hypothetical protein
MRYVVVATCELKVSDTHHPMTWVCSNGTSERSFDSSEQDAYINNCALDYTKSLWLMIALCGTKLDNVASARSVPCSNRTAFLRLF